MIGKRAFAIMKYAIDSEIFGYLFIIIFSCYRGCRSKLVDRTMLFLVFLLCVYYSPHLHDLDGRFDL